MARRQNHPNVPKNPVSPREGTTRELSRHARRLVEALSTDGALARENPMRPGFLAVAAPKGAVTTVIASLPTECASELIDKNLAKREGPAIVITPEGRAFARRLAAPAGIDPFLAQHTEIRREPPAPGEAPVAVDAAESPLAWLARRKDGRGQPLIAREEFEAGERFRRDVTVAQLLPSITSNWAAHGSRGGGFRELLPSDVAIAARQRLDRAMDALGPEFGGLVLDACGFLKRLEQIEAEHGWPARSGKVVLRMALAQLARHYGLGASARGARAGMRHWGADDYRPALDSDPGD